MESEIFKLTMKDGKDVFCYKWCPQGDIKPKAVVQIAHGMAEHAKRYERLAKFLVDAGYSVYANDHRGHGQTAGEIENLGYFADENGWNRVVDDMVGLKNHIKKTDQDLPVFLLGHSMGSFLARNFICLHGKEIKGVILSGTNGNPGFLGDIAKMIAKWECKRKGKKHRSTLLTKLSFGKFNTPFKPNRTDYDWLSRDNAEVDKYVEDSYCGGVFTAGFFFDLLSGVKNINQSENIKKIPSKLPIYLFSGEKDPVGNMTKGVQQLFNTYHKAGIKDVHIKFYNDGRHEMLNETNRKEVYKDIVVWLDDHL